MPESVNLRGSSGPTIGAIVGFSCSGVVAMGGEGYAWLVVAAVDQGRRAPSAPDGALHVRRVGAGVLAGQHHAALRAADRAPPARHVARGPRAVGPLAPGRGRAADCRVV